MRFLPLSPWSPGSAGHSLRVIPAPGALVRKFRGAAFGFGLLPQNQFGSPSKKLSSSAGERPPCFSGAPAEPGERKGDKTMFKNHMALIGFIGSDPESRQLE